MKPSNAFEMQNEKFKTALSRIVCGKIYLPQLNAQFLARPVIMTREDLTKLQNTTHYAAREKKKLYH